MSESSRAAAPQSGLRTEPANDIAIALNTHLAQLAVLVLVLTPFVVLRKAAVATMFSVVLGVELVALRLARRGRHVVAMHLTVLPVATLTSAMMVVSVHLAPPTLMLTTVLPSYALVCGRPYASAVGGAFLVGAVVVELSPRLGVVIPKHFPTSPAAQFVTGAIAMIGVIGPLSYVFTRLKDSIVAVDAEDAQRRAAERELQLRLIGDNIPDGFVYEYEVEGAVAPTAGGGAA